MSAITNYEGLLPGLRQRLLRYFRVRTRDGHDAEDLTQETLFRLCEGNANQARDKEAYAFGIAANIYREQVRRAVVRRTYDPDHGRLLAEGTSGVLAIDPERIVGSRMALEQVAQALADMPARTRNILVLFRVGGMKQADIARELAISVSSVEKHLVKASVLLAKRVDPKWL